MNHKTVTKGVTLLVGAILLLVFMTSGVAAQPAQHSENVAEKSQPVQVGEVTQPTVGDREENACGNIKGSGNHLKAGRTIEECKEENEDDREPVGFVPNDRDDGLQCVNEDGERLNDLEEIQQVLGEVISLGRDGGKCSINGAASAVATTTGTGGVAPWSITIT